MILIDEGVDNNEDYRSEKPPRAQSIASRAAKRPSGQKSEQRVLRQVRDFSRDAVDRKHGFRRSVRKQPQD